MPFEQYKKELSAKLDKSEKISAEAQPIIAKRCPKCKQLTLQFDAATSKLRCSSCGFEQPLAQ